MSAAVSKNLTFEFEVLKRFNVKFILPYYYQKPLFSMTQQETVAAPAPTKKQVRREIGDKLAGALAEYKQELGEKKLATRVKKVSKLISRDLLKISKKLRNASKKAAATAKKAADQKPAVKKAKKKPVKK